VLNILHIPLSDFSRGAEVQQPMSVAGIKLAVDICYEDVFGEEIIRQLPQATMLANLTNDAWFGHSIGPWQHLQIAQMRALESGRIMLRATNTGVTAMINQRGEVEKQAPIFTTTILEVKAQAFQGSTPFVRFGNLPALLLMALLLVATWRFRP
jgi:apolipoprotein N-acyltransferase